MGKIRSLIVDDEQSGRNSLKSWIKRYCPELELIGMAENIIEAKSIILKNNVQLVFLDIEMPRGNAFDLLESLDNIDFQVIFVTAFSEYAIQALNMSAAHYLLKPVDIDELQEAVAKVVETISNKSLIDRTSILIDNLKTINAQQRKVVIPLMEGFEVVKLVDVMYLQADDNFVHFNLTNRKSIMACRSLKFYESQLEDSGFLRIHRKHMINLEHVKRYHKGKTGRVVMADEKELDLSRNKKAEFMKKFVG